MARGLGCDKSSDGGGCVQRAYLTFSDLPTAGLGARFAAWVMLLAVAILRDEVLLIRPSTWPNSTAGSIKEGQLNQKRDVESALDCITWPHHSVVVREVSDVAQSELLNDSVISRSRRPRAVAVRLVGHRSGGHGHGKP